MRVVVIGGTGHIGTYLVPRLLQAGHSVVNVSRGGSAPYSDPGIWSFVEKATIDRGAEDRAGSFGRRIAALRPEVVIDLICFTRDSARLMVEALSGKVLHYLCCGTIWVHGPSASVPTTEEAPRAPFGEYGIRKAEMEEYLLSAARGTGFPATLLHPGHIVGEGWAPLNPAGTFNPKVFETISRGETLCLPNLGLETVHHVHADDVAQSFCRAMESRSASLGEAFHVVAASALTLRGYAEGMYRWSGKAPALEFAPWEKWRTTVSPEDAEATWDHIAHSPNCSIEKARRLLGYAPRYSPLQAVCESVDWLASHGRITLGRG
jgi:nucleoside-diphosphate-sugar epimerase